MENKRKRRKEDRKGRSLLSHAEEDAKKCRCSIKATLLSKEAAARTTCRVLLDLPDKDVLPVPRTCD